GPHGPPGSGAAFGAPHLGLYRDGRLVYVSKVGTGFDEAALGLVSDRLRPLARASSPFDVGTPAGRGHHWVEPKLVCEVRFTEWTADGGIRHPTFLGLRDDKRPEDCRRERAAKTGGRGALLRSERHSLGGPPTPPPSGAAPNAQRAVSITNPTKGFWPE